MDIAAAMQTVVDDLTAAGIRATIDGADLHPPAVLVRPPTIHYRFGKGSYDADFRAWLLVPANGQRGSLDAIGQLLTDAQEALKYRGVTATPGDANLTDGATVPMYELTWTDTIPA